MAVEANRTVKATMLGDEVERRHWKMGRRELRTRHSDCTGLLECHDAANRFALMHEIERIINTL